MSHPRGRRIELPEVRETERDREREIKSLSSIGPGKSQRVERGELLGPLAFSYIAQ